MSFQIHLHIINASESELTYTDAVNEAIFTVYQHDVELWSIDMLMYLDPCHFLLQVMFVVCCSSIPSNSEFRIWICDADAHVNSYDN